MSGASKKSGVGGWIGVIVFLVFVAGFAYLTLFGK